MMLRFWTEHMVGFKWHELGVFHAVRKAKKRENGEMTIESY